MIATLGLALLLPFQEPAAEEAPAAVDVEQVVRDAVTWLVENQQPDGSWPNQKK